MKECYETFMQCCLKNEAKRNKERLKSKIVSSSARSESTYNNQTAVSMHVLGWRVWITATQPGASFIDEQYKVKQMIVCDLLTLQNILHWQCIKIILKVILQKQLKLTILMSWTRPAVISVTG
jgi:hypothetical protein